MKQIILLILTIFLFSACSVNYQNIDLDNKKMKNEKMYALTKDIKSISKNIDQKEALAVSHDAISYSKFLANKYKVVKPALFHNTLINLNIKEKGYCYHYANDLMKYLQEKKYKSFYFKRIVSNRGEYFEHGSVLLTRDDIKFEDSIIFDAWRNSGDLFWSTVKEDKKYKWEIR